MKMTITAVCTALMLDSLAIGQPYPADEQRRGGANCCPMMVGAMTDE